VGLSLAGAAMAVPPISASDSASKRSPELLARTAAAAGPESANAIAELRSMGPEGLRVFLDTNRLEIEAALARSLSESRNGGSPAGASGQIIQSPQKNQVLAALDSVCQQKDCFASKLYWYTDLEQAKSAAREQGKLILSLRLLGRLDEDLSCANSRLFRITLYANEQISKLLRDQFVLHWQTVRPVPKLTLDFGDGRKMERTLTGNSIHYVLNSKGQVIDALPGMYGPAAFLRELERTSLAAANLTATSTDDRSAALRRYHALWLNELEIAWRNDVRRAGLRVEPSREISRPANLLQTPPSAQKAATVAFSKTALIERPILRGMSDDPRLLDSIGSDAGWSMIARMHAADASMDLATRRLMLFKDPSLAQNALQTIRALERAVAEDTVRNEYVLRARIHSWLMTTDVSPEVMSLNEKIYAELFLTPSWDAWLGLRPADAYSGIDNDGVRK
jgi:hypothetical protein